MILENDSRSLERNMEMRQISQNITLLRQLRKVSLEALSLALDVPLKDLKKIESATKPEISLTLLLDIANYFKVTPALFFDGF
ncbi:MAG: helix-turn-helix domain-containing protein [Succinivibrio sp.]